MVAFLGGAMVLLTCGIGVLFLMVLAIRGAYSIIMGR